MACKIERPADQDPRRPLEGDVFNHCQRRLDARGRVGGEADALADPRDLKGLMLLEPLVNDVILDEREPGSFDPLAAMRRKLSDDIVKSRFHILELERHRNRVRQHIDRLGRKAGTDFLGSMLRARSQSITEAIRNAEGQIQAIEQAYSMLEGYSYELAVALEPLSVAVKGEAAE